MNNMYLLFTSLWCLHKKFKGFTNDDVGEGDYLQ